MNDGIKAGFSAVLWATIIVCGFLSIFGVLFIIKTLFGGAAMCICFAVAAVFALGVVSHYDGGGLI